MSQFYYLVSSLPMLKWEEELQIDSSEFLAACRTWVSDDEYDYLESLDLVPGQEPWKNGIETAWNNWETCLRNRLVAVRAGELGRDAEENRRHENDYYSEIERGVQEAWSRPNPLAREKLLDQVRWSRLNDLESGQSFGFAMLCLYRLKLLLLEKWTERKSEPGKENLDLLVERIYQESAEKHMLQE